MLYAIEERTEGNVAYYHHIVKEFGYHNITLSCNLQVGIFNLLIDWIRSVCLTELGLNLEESFHLWLKSFTFPEDEVNKDVYDNREHYRRHEFNSDARFSRVTPDSELHRMCFEASNVFWVVEPVSGLLILDEMPEPKSKPMIRAGRKERVICRIRAPPDFFNDVICELALQEGIYFVSGYQI